MKFNSTRKRKSRKRKSRKRKSRKRRGGGWFSVLHNLTRNCASIPNKTQKTECYIDQGNTSKKLFSKNTHLPFYNVQSKHITDDDLYTYYNDIATELETLVPLAQTAKTNAHNEFTTAAATYYPGRSSKTKFQKIKANMENTSDALDRVTREAKAARDNVPPKPEYAEL